MQRRVLFIILVFLSAALGCAAQESYLRHYGRSEGLPSSELYWTIQDRKGYIWIASDMGAIRFDGYHFRVFTTADGLTDNTVFRFYEDRKGRIWFYTFSGRLCYYFNDSIYSHNLPVNSEVRDFLGQHWLTDLTVDADDTILAGSPKGLIRLIPHYDHGAISWDHMQVVTTVQTNLLRRGYITTELQDDHSMLATRYIPGRPPYRNVIPSCDGLTEYGRYHSTDAFIFYDKKAAYLDTLGGMRLYDDLDASVIGFFAETDSTLWIGEKHGGAHLISHMDFLHPVRTLLKPFSVTSVMRDHEGGYWFTTLDDGLFYLPSARFTYLETGSGSMPAPHSYLSQRSLHVLDADRVLEPASQTVFTADGRSAPQPSLYFPSRIPSRLDTMIFDIYRHPDGEVWVSGSSGVAIFDSSMTHYIRHVDRLSHDFDSRSLLMDRQQHMWSLNLSSITRIDHRTKKILTSARIPARAEAACEDYDGSILIGTLNGLYRLQHDSLIFLGSHDPLYRNRFVDIKKSNGRVIFATRGAGIIIREGEHTHQITVAEHLPSDMCRSIYIDTAGVIWVSTNNGLASIRTQDAPFRYIIRTYTASDGLLCDDNAQVLRNGKVVWLLSGKGITAFDPNEALSNAVAPPVYITRVLINKVALPPDSVRVLDYSTNFIEIDFVGLTYRNAGRQYYSYKLTGYDTTQTISQNTFVQFTRLPPGDYRFEVTCVNNSGVISRPAVLSFRIIAPFYLEWWFTLLVLMLVIALIMLSAWVYIRRIRHRESEKAGLKVRIANLELQALRAQMNPHFIFNCLNAIQDFILSHDTESAKYYLSNFSKLIRKTLDHSRRSDIVLSDEISFLRLYMDLERMRFSDRFDCQIDVDSSVNEEGTHIPSMILQPFVENAIRHGRIGSMPVQGLLTVGFHMLGDTLICTITDNGVGYNHTLQMKDKSDHSVNAHALGLISERIRTINEINLSDVGYTITDRSDIDPITQGTVVVIRIPFIK